MDRTGNKLAPERQILYAFSYMWSLTQTLTCGCTHTSTPHINPQAHNRKQKGDSLGREREQQEGRTGEARRVTIAKYMIYVTHQYTQMKTKVNETKAPVNGRNRGNGGSIKPFRDAHVIICIISQRMSY